MDGLLSEVRRLCRLMADSVKLTIAEKLTILISAGIVIGIFFVIGSIALIFILGAVAYLLAEQLSPYMACFIVAMMCLLLIIIIFILRRRLIVDRVARFISRIFIDLPDNKVNDYER